MLLDLNSIPIADVGSCIECDRVCGSRTVFLPILREASTSVWTSDKNFCISCSNGTNDSKETIKSKRWPCCAFRTKPATDSGANRPPNPVGNRLLKTGFPERWPISRKGGRFPGIGSHDRNERRWTPSVR